MSRVLLLLIILSSQKIINIASAELHRSSYTIAKHNKDKAVPSTKHQLFSIPGYRLYNNYSTTSSSIYCPVNPSLYSLKSIIISKIGSIDKASLSVPNQSRSMMHTTKTHDSKFVFNYPTNSQCYLLQFSSSLSNAKHMNIHNINIQFIYDAGSIETDDTTTDEFGIPYLIPSRNANTHCGSSTCQNGGRCLSTVAQLLIRAYQCHVTRLDNVFIVQMLPIIVKTTTTTTVTTPSHKSCLSNRFCLNGGTCVYKGNYNDVTCVCPQRYSGARCQISDQSMISTTPTPNTCGICEIKPRIDFGDRIVNGQPVNSYVWPWIVSLQNRGSHFCGGTLIDAFHVITAAHCFDPPSTQLNVYEVVAGLLNLRQSDLRAVQKFSIDRIFRHEGYNSRKLINDIAIIKLRKPAQITLSVYPICLPNGDGSQDPKVGQIVQIAGWGYTNSATKQIAQQLQEAYIEILNHNGDLRGGPGCSVWAQRGNPMNEARQICAMSRDTRTDSCQGDSGGPLIRNINSKWYLFGIVSYGDAICASSKAAGVYTRVSAFIPWIQNKLKL
ncbi:hypothetical protein I4U23_019615 [Adineta vaga]|nr:hypothetical protein I4U23_019615 [Adineta vaga]